MIYSYCNLTWIQYVATGSCLRKPLARPTTRAVRVRILQLPLPRGAPKETHKNILKFTKIYKQIFLDYGNDSGITWIPL